MNQIAPLKHLKNSQIILTAGSLITLVVLIFGGYVGLALGLGFTGHIVAKTLPYAVFILSVLASVILFTLRKRFDIGWEDLGVVKPTKRLTHLLWQVPTLLVLLVLVQVLFGVLVLGGQNPADSSSGWDKENLSFAPQVVLFISTAVLTPVWEELFFRGFVWNWLSRRLSIVMTAVVSALIFAVCHGVPVLLPYMVTLGLGLGYLRWFHRSIWGNLVFHLVLNTMVAGSALLVLGS